MAVVNSMSLLSAVIESGWQIDRTYSIRLLRLCCKSFKPESQSFWSWRRSEWPASDKVLLSGRRRYLNWG